MESVKNVENPLLPARRNLDVIIHQSNAIHVDGDLVMEAAKTKPVVGNKCWLDLRSFGAGYSPQIIIKVNDDGSFDTCDEGNELAIHRWQFTYSADNLLIWNRVKLNNDQYKCTHDECEVMSYRQAEWNKVKHIFEENHMQAKTEMSNSQKAFEREFRTGRPEIDDENFRVNEDGVTYCDGIQRAYFEVWNRGWIAGQANINLITP